jgi:hypothetical protein
MMEGETFDIDFDDDSITIEHHSRKERLSVIRDGEQWQIERTPINGDFEGAEQTTVDSRGDAWERVIHYIDHGLVTVENTSLNGEQQ